jgi:hypothetical protein
VAPLGFAFLHLPVIHSLIIFLMLVLITWAASQYGAASVVSVIGSAIVVLANLQVFPVLGFLPAAFPLDFLMLANNHKINLKALNVAIVILASIVCAFVAAVVNGFLIGLGWMFTFTVWAGWNVLGTLFGVVVALPIIAALERAQVKRVQLG